MAKFDEPYVETKFGVFSRFTGNGVIVISGLGVGVHAWKRIIRKIINFFPLILCWSSLYFRIFAEEVLCSAFVLAKPPESAHEMPALVLKNGIIKYFTQNSQV